MASDAVQSWRTGTGLIETLIALMIVAIGLASAYPLVTQAGFAVRRGRDHYVATTIALATLEGARNVSRTQLPQLARSNVRVDDQGTEDADGRFRRTVTVQPDVPAAGLTLVTAVVEIIDHRRGGFHGEMQRVSMAFTDY